MHRIWQGFREEQIRLVTDEKDTETDIILWLNRQGCCITDTLRAMEAVEEYGTWHRVDVNEAKQYKQLLDYYGELEILPPGQHGGGKGIDLPPGSEAALLSLLRQEILDSAGGDNDTIPNLDEELRLLHECTGELNLWYTDAQWGDMKRTDYELNWGVLESVLKRHGMKTAFQGKEGERNRNLFGLLNRAVGLGKKSCRKLPMTESHKAFVINMALQKYNEQEQGRYFRHILHCLRQGVDFLINIDNDLIERFNEKKNRLQTQLRLPPVHLELISPPEFLRKILDVP